MHFKNGTPGPADHGRRRRHATGLRSALTDTSTPLALIAGALSFTHIRDIALAAGQNGWTGWAYPLIVDLITVDAYRRLKTHPGRGAGLPWTWLIIGATASLGANIADAIMHAPPKAGAVRLLMCVLIGMWPAVAFLGSMLLRHSDPPADRPAPAPAIQPMAESARRPADRPAAPNVRPADQPSTDPRPIPVQPTGHPGAWAELGPRAASAGELRMGDWVRIGRPVYQQVKAATGDRPTEAEMRQALIDRVQTLIGTGALPPAVGQPSLSTAKRIRAAIETAHPELKAHAVQSRRMAAITA